MKKYKEETKEQEKLLAEKEEDDLKSNINETDTKYEKLSHTDEESFLFNYTHDPNSSSMENKKNKSPYDSKRILNPNESLYSRNFFYKFS